MKSASESVRARRAGRRLCTRAGRLSSLSGTTVNSLRSTLFDPVGHRFNCGAVEPVNQHGGGGPPREPWTVALEHERQFSVLPRPLRVGHLKEN
jgi:hypothetical protein